MPITREKVITLNKWHSGMADVDLDEYASPGQGSYVQLADLIESQPFLRPTADPVDDSSGLIATGRIGRIRGYATRRQSGTQGRVYAVDYGTAVGGGGVERLGVFLMENYGDGWTAVDHDETAGIGASEPTAGCEFFDNDDLFFCDSNSGSEVSIARCRISTSTILVGWDILNTSTWSAASGTINRFLRHTDDNLYILQGGNTAPKLGFYDGVTSPSSTTPVSLPLFYEPVDMISWGNKILVLANSTRGEGSILLVRDPYQSYTYTFDDIYPLSIFRACALRRVAGRIIILTADFDYKIYQWLGGNEVKLLKTLEGGAAYNTAENMLTQFTIRPEAVDVYNEILYFGTTFTVNTTFRNGVYAFGFNPDGSTFLHNAFLDHADDESNIRWRALKVYDDTASLGIVSTAYDVTGDAYRNMRWVIGATRAGAMRWESVWMRPFPGLKSQIVKCSLYHEDMGAGSITISHRKDADTDYLTIGSASGDDSFKTVFGNNLTHEGTFTRTSTNTFTSGHKHKIRIAMTSGAQLEKVKLRVRTTQQE